MTETPSPAAGESLTITLPDERELTLASPTSVAEIAAAIGPGLARQALAGRVDGALVDAGDPITRDARVQVITPSDPRGWRSSATPAPTWWATPSSSSTPMPRW